MATDLLKGKQSTERKTLISSTGEAANPGNKSLSLGSLAQTGLWRGLETILLVEDEPFVRKAAAEALESAGYRLLIAGSASEALEAYHESFHLVDLLLADVVMPGMSGRDLAVEVKRLSTRARVLLMSGYEGQLAEYEQSLYAKKFLAKPFSIRTLLSRVREVLDANPFDPKAQA